MGAPRHAPDPACRPALWPTCLARSARLEVWMRHLRCHSPTPTQCSVTSTRSPSMSPETLMPCCCLIAPDGTRLHDCESRLAEQHHADPVAVALAGAQSGRAGLAISARETTSQTASLKPTKPLSTQPALRGESSQLSRIRLHQSACCFTEGPLYGH